MWMTACIHGRTVDDATDLEEEEVRAREEAAEGQTAQSQQTHGNINSLRNGAR
jgi:hypothetical protein